MELVYLAVFGWVLFLVGAVSLSKGLLGYGDSIDLAFKLLGLLLMFAGGLFLLLRLAMQRGWVQ